MHKCFHFITESQSLLFVFIHCVRILYIGDYLACSGVLTIPLFTAPACRSNTCQFDFELILALMAAINLYIGIYIYLIYVYSGHLIVFWVMWDLLFSFFNEFHSLTNLHLSISFISFALNFVVAFFSFLCFFLPAFRYFIQFLDAFVQRPHERLFLRKTYKNKKEKTKQARRERGRERERGVYLIRKHGK